MLSTLCTANPICCSMFCNGGKILLGKVYNLVGYQLFCFLEFSVLVNSACNLV